MTLLEEACHWMWAVRFQQPGLGTVLLFLLLADPGVEVSAPSPTLHATKLPAMMIMDSQTV